MSMSPSGITVIKVKTVIDGTGSTPKSHQAVVIEGDSIREILPQDQLSFPEGTLVQTINYPDGYLLPGLIDAHAHLMFGVHGATYEEVIENDTDEIMLLRAAKNARIHLLCGVTTLRENGARNRITFDLREGAERGYVTAPRLLLCGRPVTVTGGHFFWCNQEADGVEGVRAAVRQLIKEGADHIKIMASGGGTAITDNRLPSYSVDELRAIVDETHNMGKLTTAHCLATKSITNALDAHVDMIEHAAFIEPDGSFKFDSRIVERIAKQGVYISPTVQTGYRQREELLIKESQAPLNEPSRLRLDGLKAKCESQLEFLRRMREEWDIDIISGTDSIQLFGDYCLGLELMSNAGMSNQEIITSSTSLAAQAIGVDRTVGTISPGKCADLIVVEKDPLRDITALRDISMVMREGEIIN